MDQPFSTTRFFSVFIRWWRTQGLGARLALFLIVLGGLLGSLGILKIIKNAPRILTDSKDSWAPMADALVFIAGPDGNRLYETLFFERQLKFQYPPTSLLPLDLLSTVTTLSPQLLNLINVAIFLANIVVVALLARTLLVENAPRGTRLSDQLGARISDNALMLMAAAACLAFYPLTKALELGQIQTWLDCAFALACLFWVRGRQMLAGVVIGLAVALKPQLGLLLLWALVGRQWDFVRGFLIVAAPIGLVSLARYGLDNHLSYLQVLSFISQHGESFHANNSVNGIVHRLLFNGPNTEWQANAFAPFHPVVYAATLVSSIVFILLPLVLAWRREGRPATVAEFGAAGLCFTLAAPVAWEHHYGILPPLFVVALHAIAISRGDRERSYLALSVAWFLSAAYMPFTAVLKSTPLNFVQAHLFFGALLLLYLLIQYRTPRDTTVATTSS